MAAQLFDDRYRLGEVLGSGAMGIVRAASDERLGRRVAIKLLPDNLAMDRLARERFEREARAAARVVHPNVVMVHDVGVATLADDDERPYIVMELVEGGSLREQLLASGPLDPDDVAAVAVQALAGLGAAHDVGLLHRDLKPANLLRDAAGTVKLTDFGIAHAGEQPGLTRTGYVLGSLNYLAPERLRGEPATRATDVYGLAATLLELLHGEPRERDQPIRFPAGTPGGLRRMIERSLATEPAHRPQDVIAATDMLLGRGEPTPSTSQVAEVETVRVPSAAGGAPTEVLAPTATVPTDPGVATSPPLGGASRTAPGAAGDVPTGARDPRPWWRRPTWVAAAIVGIALLVTLVFSSGGGGEPDAPAEPATEQPGAPAQDPLLREAEDLRERVRELVGR